MIAPLAQKLSLKPEQVQAVATLVEGGATVPFIARYRKESTGSLDEVQIRSIVEGLQTMQALAKRREAMLKSLEERKLLQPEIRKSLQSATTLADLEEAYLPHRAKKTTRASTAKERGLEPLAKEVFFQGPMTLRAESFVNPERELPDVDAVWAGVRDIMAEWISENLPLRKRLRDLFRERGFIESKVVKKKMDDAEKYKDYFDDRSLLCKTPAHRLHAMLRGQKEGFLRIKLLADERETTITLTGAVIKRHSAHADQVKAAMVDAYNRLLAPSLENELLGEAKAKADREAIEVFAANLHELIMAAPLGQKSLVALDPGFRTGCKAVHLDAQGKFLDYQTLFPFGSADQKQKAEAWLREKVEGRGAQAIAVGNGTAGRETESFATELKLGVPVIQVSESGASIYSASEAGREEFPNLDLTVRGSISIGRRLQDPLAELVKLDPGSIGVGQYQHDVDQKWLEQRLEQTIESCVNGVGVELNSASARLLTFVSGLGPKLAEAVVQHRQENGPFKRRKDLLKVPRLGPKVYEQAVGFLRVRGGDDPLDASAVHPERYPVVLQMAKDLGVKVPDLLGKSDWHDKVQLAKYQSEDLGLPTLKDILHEMAKPGRDPRPHFEAFSFSDEVQKIEDLREGQTLPGIVTNVTKFGAFVDIGVHQDGLVHISQLADHFVKDPLDVVKVQQKVRVRVLEVDVKRKRIGLSMKSH